MSAKHFDLDRTRRIVDTPINKLTWRDRLYLAFFILTVNRE